MSAFITDTLIEGKIIKMEERNLYLYCFGTLIEMTANLITTLIIGALLGKIVASFDTKYVIGGMILSQT